jgi:hypothetical protein
MPKDAIIVRVTYFWKGGWLLLTKVNALNSQELMQVIK